MDNPSLILQTVDRRLDHEVRLVIYGRAAVCLGFDSPPPESARTEDVDAIISVTQSVELKNDPVFWDAIEAANVEIAEKGLYITHLFNEDDIFLRNDWNAHVVPVSRPLLRWLQLYRPATVDLVLSKMMRGSDPQDMADAAFMILHDRITEDQLLVAFENMKPFKFAELQDAFHKAKPLVLQFARSNTSK